MVIARTISSVSTVELRDTTQTNAISPLRKKENKMTQI